METVGVLSWHTTHKAFPSLLCVKGQRLPVLVGRMCYNMRKSVDFDQMHKMYMHALEQNALERVHCFAYVRL